MLYDAFIRSLRTLTASLDPIFQIYQISTSHIQFCIPNKAAYNEKLEDIHTRCHNIYSFFTFYREDNPILDKWNKKLKKLNNEKLQ